MSAYPVTDSVREWATAFVESCRYVAEQRNEPFDADKWTARIRESLTNPGPVPLVDDSGFEAPGAYMSDPGHEGADLLEARETAWREGLR